MLATAMASEPARFITDLMAHNLALAGRCAAQPEVVVSEALKATVRRALVERTQDPRVDLRRALPPAWPWVSWVIRAWSDGTDPMARTCYRRSSRSLGARITSAAMKGCMLTKRLSTAWC